MIGHVWTVDQDTHNTVTCEFYDREAHHQFFFTDPYLYDKACLSTSLWRALLTIDDYAALFASSAGSKNGSMLFYRPHEIEGTTRQDWRFEMPPGENITCIHLSIHTLIISHRIESFSCCGLYIKGVRPCLYHTGYPCPIIQTKVYARRDLCKLEELCYGSWKWWCFGRWFAFSLRCDWFV